ncbi:tRNA (adenosine(37)-N6)-dimethylallyltransferase MiaA [Afifella sp. IM 167]|uniref:tRNA (adenosine(37)-N6)-dimethylallyltransferase MiaA n=1 Tax=Afifella sp. IM 167 TaxID=2033586 RepID=UPI001CCC44CC|nr:tRNA (adenosine(37)-N6)-dimethylallyltransferase MiaA [Afifella sp. IM 167]MBZ8135233.1 tRNA (adenosine(37)-N6)-dimethylallyltransferase MiaA [Afifella sp. IM 167]
MRIDPAKIGEGEVVLIAGPTAGGKTRLALDLAAALATGGRRACLVNADSMQVYGDLRILTARPAREEFAGVAHHLFGHVDAGEAYSVGRWIAEVEEVLAGVRQRGETAIFVGGTGLYFKALSEGISSMPDVPEAVREEVRALAAREGAQGLARRLIECDPQAAAAIRPSDTQRLVRALEVNRASGRSILAFQREGRERALVPDGPRFVLLPAREALYAAIDRRFEAMVEEGALEEVRSLLARELSSDLPAMKAIGVRPLAEHLRGNISLGEAVEAAKTESRRYAKRQLTWLRHQLGEGWERLEPAAHTASGETA